MGIQSQLKKSHRLAAMSSVSLINISVESSPLMYPFIFPDLAFTLTFLNTYFKQGPCSCRHYVIPITITADTHHLSLQVWCNEIWSSVFQHLAYIFNYQHILTMLFKSKAISLPHSNSLFLYLLWDPNHSHIDFLSY